MDNQGNVIVLWSGNKVAFYFCARWGFFIVYESERFHVSWVEDV